jgi:hypothetical protein
VQSVKGMEGKFYLSKAIVMTDMMFGDAIERKERTY